jgi:hypothetical protein
MKSRNIETVKHSPDCPYEATRTTSDIGMLSASGQALILACPSPMHDTARFVSGIKL